MTAMSKRDGSKDVSAVGAGLILVGLVGWSVLASIHDVSSPWKPVLPEPEWFQVVIGLGGLVGLLWTVIFARRAWRESKRAADAAVEASKAATDGLELQRRTTVAELRPYVHELRIETHRVFVRENSDDENSLLIATHYQIRWKNSGQTPALGLMAGGNIGFFTEPLPSDFPFPDAREDLTGASQAPLGQDSDRAIPSELLPISHLAAVQAGTHRLYGWSWVEYSDDFPDTPRYRSELAFELIVTGDPLREGASFAPEILDRFNGMDGECLRKPRTGRRRSLVSAIIADEN